MAPARKTNVYIAFLRGINVGGNVKLLMADLRPLLAACGYEDVVTHLQSGNAVFRTSKTTAKTTARKVEQTIEQAVAEQLGLKISVLVRTPVELAEVIKNNPLPKATASGSRFFVTFLSTKLDADGRKLINELDLSPDQVVAGEREFYMWCPEGSGRSPAGKFPWERRLQRSATTRNWNTVTKMLQLSES